jgi:hypothetical protein
MKVTSAAELIGAAESEAKEIEVVGTISGMPMVTLRPGVSLRGGVLRFGARGLRLTSDNTLAGVTIETADEEVAILNDTAVAELGTLALYDVTTVGQVLILGADAVRTGHVEIDGLHVGRADLRGRELRPHGYGVDALQGAVTIWNRQPDPAVELTARLRGLSVGTAETPVRGSGVFVGGHGDREGNADGGVLRVSELETGEIHTDGGIPAGTPDLISGGVFVISGAVVGTVVDRGPVTTYGQNDMVLDNWGEVGRWTAEAPVTSRGPSGIGFVNFGKLGALDVTAPIQTFGVGARGFNVYDGTLDSARFDSIATHGDGSVGVQVSKSLPRLEITGDLTTEGGTGTSLVKGVQTQLQAIALSVQAGGVIDQLHVGGEMRTTGAGVATLDVDGTVGSISVDGGVHAAGPGSCSVRVDGRIDGLEALVLDPPLGEPLP